MIRKFNPMGWEMHREYCKIDITYLKDKIAHNIAFKSIQYNRFNRAKYKLMIIKIVSMDLENYTLKEIGQEVSRSPERIRQILAKFYRRLRYVIEHDNKP